MMRQGLWSNVLRFLVKVSRVDLNEELLKENEYLKAEIDVYRKQLERLGNLTERPHQGIGNSLVEPDGKLQIEPPEPKAPLEWDCRRRLGGLLKSYSRKAA